MSCFSYISNKLPPSKCLYLKASPTFHSLFSRFVEAISDISLLNATEFFNTYISSMCTFCFLLCIGQPRCLTGAGLEQTSPEG